MLWCCGVVLYAGVLQESFSASLQTASRTMNQFVSLVAASPTLTEAEFVIFYQFAAQDFAASAVLSAAWAPYVSNANRTEWERLNNANITNLVSSNPTVWERVPDDAREYYFPNALNASPSFVGYDLMGQPGRSASVLRCVKSAKQTASPIYLFPSAQTDGFLLFLPLYSSPPGTPIGPTGVVPPVLASDAPNTTEARWRDIRGVVLGAVPISGLFSRVATHEPIAYDSIVMSLYDTTLPSPTEDGYHKTSSSQVSIRDKTNTFEVDESQAAFQTFEFAQRSYQMRCDPISGMVDTSQQTIVISVLAFILSVLVVSAVLTVAHRNRLQRGLEIAQMRSRYAQRQNRQLDLALTQKQNLINLLTTAQKEIEAASQAKSSFMSYLCHELRSMCVGSSLAFAFVLIVCCLSVRVCHSLLLCSAVQIRCMLFWQRSKCSK